MRSKDLFEDKQGKNHIRSSHHRQKTNFSTTQMTAKVSERIVPEKHGPNRLSTRSSLRTPGHGGEAPCAEVLRGWQNPRSAGRCRGAGEGGQQASPVGAGGANATASVGAGLEPPAAL